MTANMLNEGPLSPVPSSPEVVVGLDDSPAAAAALRWAAAQCRLTGVPLRVVHVWQMKARDAAAAASVSTGTVYWEAASVDARARATRWVLDDLGATAAEIRWSLDITEGPPGPVLVRRSQGARLLVLGTREQTGLRRAILGSVSHYCLSHAEAPMVAVAAERANPSLAVVGSVAPAPVDRVE